MKTSLNSTKNEQENMQQVISQALKIANPNAKDKKELEKISNEIINRINKSQYNGHIVKIMAVGSFAKDTFLKNDADIDIFIVFENSLNNKTFEEMGLKIGFYALENYDPRTRYSEHPYVEGFVPLPSDIETKKGDDKEAGQVRINIVPCYDVKKGEWKSSADRSPFHTQYMLENLDAERKEQVRLLKLFLKGIKVYGAELSTAGFSGYVAEVLIVKYRTFLSVLEEIANSREERKIILIDSVIDPNIDTITYKEKLLSRFSDSSIIIIDPIDHNRNLGTAISNESLSRFILQARNFLKNPSVDYFIYKEKDTYQFLQDMKSRIDSLKVIDPKLIDNLFSSWIFVEFSHEQMVPDVIWGQILKFKKSIEKQLNFYGFKVLKSSCTTNENDKALCIFCLESINLPYFTIKEGPSIYMKDSTEKFLESNNAKVVISWTSEDMKLNFATKREFTNAITLLEYLLKEKTNEIGVPKGLRKTIRDSFKIFDGFYINEITSRKNIKDQKKFSQYIQVIDDILN